VTNTRPDVGPPQHVDEQQVEEKWRAYPNTILEFAGSPPLRLDLRERVTDDTRAALAALGLGAAFGVFTAENPAGENAEDAPTERAEERRERANDRRNSQLERELDARAVEYVPVDGVSPDGQYREHCIATLVARDEAVALARRYAQLALFWFDGESFWLLPALATKPAMRLPISERDG
jgi:hypothetical protein